MMRVLALTVAAMALAALLGPRHARASLNVENGVGGCLVLDSTCVSTPYTDSERSISFIGAYGNGSGLAHSSAGYEISTHSPQHPQLITERAEFIISVHMLIRIPPGMT